MGVVRARPRGSIGLLDLGLRVAVEMIRIVVVRAGRLDGMRW